MSPERARGAEPLALGAHVEEAHEEQQDDEKGRSFSHFFIRREIKRCADWFFSLRIKYYNNIKFMIIITRFGAYFEFRIVLNFA